MELIQRYEQKADGLLIRNARTTYRLTSLLRKKTPHKKVTFNIVLEAACEGIPRESTQTSNIGPHRCSLRKHAHYSNKGIMRDDRGPDAHLLSQRKENSSSTRFLGPF